MFGSFMDRDARSAVDEKSLQNMNEGDLERADAVVPFQPSNGNGAMVVSDGRDPVLAIDGMRRDLGAQRKMLDDFYSKLEPLVARCVSLSEDMDTIKKELDPAQLRQIFVTNSRFTEVTADLKLEMKTTQVAASSKTGMNGSSLQAMGTQISQAVNTAFMQGSQQQSQVVMPTLDSMKQNMDKLHQQMESMRQEFNYRLSDMRGEVLAKPTFGDSGYLEIRDVKAELKQDISTLHDLLEHTALKAGHLAIAASECTSDQKSVLFQTLKQKEMQIAGRKIQGFPAMPQTLSTSPELVFDNLLMQLPPLDSARSQTTGSKTPPFVAAEEYNISLQCRPGEKLGLSLNGQDGRTLLIERIADGALQAWNMMNPTAQVKPGDRIVAVNGERGDSRRLMQIATESTNQGRELLYFTIGTARQDSSREYLVRLFVMKDEKLGLSLDSDESGALLVTGINPGLVANWNQAHPDKAVMAGHRLIAANNESQDQQLIIQETAKGGELTLTMRRF